MIKQLAGLVLMSQTIKESSRPGSPVKIDFDVSISGSVCRPPSSPPKANIETPPSFNKNSSTRREIDSQAVQILVLENMLCD